MHQSRLEESLQQQGETHNKLQTAMLSNLSFFQERERSHVLNFKQTQHQMVCKNIIDQNPNQYFNGEYCNQALKQTIHTACVRHSSLSASKSDWAVNRGFKTSDMPLKLQTLQKNIDNQTILKQSITKLQKASIDIQSGHRYESNIKSSAFNRHYSEARNQNNTIPWKLSHRKSCPSFA